MAKPAGTSLISEESVGFLDDVKKGKPRRFVMICKGAQIVSLVVYKKGSLERFKKEAKESGSGLIYHGIVDGKGVNLDFQLAKTEGFEKEPTRNQALKQFLEEHAELKCKPTFVLVESLPELLDDDELSPAERPDGQPAVNPPTAPPVSDAQSASAAPPPSPPSSAAAINRDELARFTARVNALKPGLDLLKQATDDAGKQRATECSSLARQAVGLAQKQDFAAAHGLLEQVEQLLQAPTQSAASPVVPAGTVDYAKCRLAWDAAKKKVHAELQALEQAILTHFRGAAAFPELAKKVRALDDVLAGFAEGLADQLDEAQNEADPARRQERHAAAAKTIARYRERVTSDPFIAQIQANPFVPVSISKTLGDTLAALAKRVS
jgi:hypothetical protein